MEYLVTFLFLFAAHYVKFDHLLPWKMEKADGSPTPARFLLNYVIGTVGMLAPFAWRLWMLGELELLMSLGLFVAVAGLAPFIAYGNDRLLDLKRTVVEKTEQAELYKNQRGANESGEGV